MLMKVARTAVRLEVQTEGRTVARSPVSKTILSSFVTSHCLLRPTQSTLASSSGPRAAPFWQGAAGAPPPGRPIIAVLWSQTLQTTVLCG